MCNYISDCLLSRGEVSLDEIEERERAYEKHATWATETSDPDGMMLHDPADLDTYAREHGLGSELWADMEEYPYA